MTEPIAEYGNEVGICGSPDGSTWEKVLTVDGKLQIDVESTGNPGNLDIAISALRDAICASAPTGNDLSDLYTRLGSILTELEAKLETADLNIEAGSKDLQVDVKSCANPTNLDIAISALRDAICASAPTGNDLSDLYSRLGDILTELEAKLETADLGSGTTRYINALLQGYTGTSWQKSGLPWSYYDRWSENFGGTKVGDGTYSVSSAAIPAGYVYVLQACTISNNSGARGITSIYLATGGYIVHLAATPTPAQYVPLVFTGNVVLKTGDVVTVWCGSCLNGDVMYGGVRGYMMRTNM